jgi:hypothetical protein
MNLPYPSSFCFALLPEVPITFVYRYLYYPIENNSTFHLICQFGMLSELEQSLIAFRKSFLVGLNCTFIILLKVHILNNITKQE